MIKTKNIVVLTGAGISQESGIQTFRGSNGLWENHRIEEIASMEGFERNPQLVNNFYNSRRRQLFEPSLNPNQAHFALAELEEKWKGGFLLVTQNVDNLHERAGSKNVLHMHGELLKARCIKMACKKSKRTIDWSMDIHSNIFCEACNEAYDLRPDVVWFGERPLSMDIINSALSNCDIFISIGSSGTVFPAAGFVEVVPNNCRKIEVNVGKTKISEMFDESIFGLASIKVPFLVLDLLRI